jgi:uncharacterized damage-inducible protein DinB
LLGLLAQQRYMVRLTAFGLTDAESRLTPTVSSLSVGGLIKHNADVEKFWIQDIVHDYQGWSMPENLADAHRLTADESLEWALAYYDEVAKETERIIGDIADLGQAVAVPKDVPWFPKDVEFWSVRWVLLHLIEETGRHTGHADIIRESIDGGTMHPIIAAAEGWPESPWLKPWKAKG